jgi:hypothetical protein
MGDRDLRPPSVTRRYRSGSTMPEDWAGLMRRGDFERAWQLSDRAIRRLGADEWKRPRHEQRIWNGTTLRGRRVLVRCYHGLGDTLQFVRYLPRVYRMAADLTVWIQPALIPLLSTTDQLGRLLPLHEGAPEVDFDVDAEIMELPHVFRTQVETIPDRVPYIDVRDPRRDGPASALRVGVVWTAGTWDDRRSIPFSLLDPLLGLADAEFVTLQPVRTAGESARFAQHAHTLSIEETARVMAGCDLVVTVDTMAAHLAGALGVSGCVMLRAEADWRWMNDRSDSPWYPSLTLFRQPRAGEWRSVVGAVRDFLLRALSARHSRPAR